MSEPVLTHAYQNKLILIFSGPVFLDLYQILLGFVILIWPYKFLSLESR